MKKIIKGNWSNLVIVVFVIILIILISLTSKFFLKPNNTSTTQIANPASVNCTKNGGKLSIVDESEGQVGMCTLSDGTLCEEWAYFRGECQ